MLSSLTLATRLVAMWLGASAWHLFRIGTLRPAFKQLGDTKFVLLTFLFFYFVAGVLRWQVVSPDAHTLWEVLFGLAFHAVILASLCNPLKYSFSILAVMLGVSTCVDVVAAGLFMIDVTDSIKGAYWLIIEIVMSVVCWIQFRRQSDQIKASGYSVTR